MKKVYIYALENPKNKKIRYIGKTTQKLEKRLIAHIYESKHRNNHKCNWIKKLLKEDVKPSIRLIDIVCENDWEFWESYWIEQFKSWGFNLVNQTPGGEGYSHSDETKNKISLANSGSNHYFYGKKHKKSTIKKIKNSLKGNQYAKGYKHSDETKRKVKENNAKFWLGKKRSEITKEKISNTKSSPIYQLSFDGNILKKFNSVKEAVDKTGINRTGIYKCLKEKQKTCGGFIWKWAN